ncbi:MAG TPA: helicase-related protein [Longimicrobium sp.]|jgi:hypothetical protein
MIDHGKIDPAAILSPEQLQFVELVKAAHPPRRFVLSGAPGSGKTSAMIAALAALPQLSELRRGRSLVIAPGEFLQQYAMRMERFSAPVRLVDPPAYRRMQAESDLSGNPWLGSGYYLVSPQFLMKGHRLAEVLATEWDEVLFDGSDAALVAQWSEVLGVFWASSKITSVLAVLPSTDLAMYGLRRPATQIVQWSVKRAVVMPERRIHPVEVQLSEAEAEFARQIKASTDQLTAASPKDAVFAHSLLRAWGSSLYAVEQVLRRAVIAHEAEWRPDLDRSERELSTRVDLGERGRVEATNLLHALERITGDSKWSQCETILLKLFSRKRTEPVVLYTDSRETALYLSELTKERDFQTSVLIGLGESNVVDLSEERLRASQVIIATTHSSKGMEFSSDSVIHYDLPENPLLYWVRMTRVSPSRRAPVDHYVLIDAVGTTRMSLERAEASMEKLPTSTE